MHLHVTTVTGFLVHIDVMAITTVMITRMK